MARKSGLNLGKLLGSAAKSLASSPKRPAPSREKRSEMQADNLPPDSYLVPLVGEQQYQAAIGTAKSGDRVQVLAEWGNPYDVDAVAVADRDGRTLGYLPRDNWLRGALLQEKKGCRAAIHKIAKGNKGVAGVVLVVRLAGDGPIGQREYVPAGQR